MSTRGFLGFAINGELKIGYNHSDSYPSWLGEKALKFAQTACAPEAITETRSSVASLVLVNEEEPPTPEQIEALEEFANLTVGTQKADDWYVLLRETQGQPAAILRAGFMIDGCDFPADSLFCEWGYLIDFDAETFEVYRGFVQGKAEGRFAGIQIRHDSGYGPVTLIASWPFSALPESLDEDALGEPDGGDR
jgi:hypothetical protein